MDFDPIFDDFFDFWPDFGCRFGPSFCTPPKTGVLFDCKILAKENAKN